MELAHYLSGAFRTDAVRHFASGFLRKMRLHGKPLVVVFDFAAPGADMEEAFQITESRNDHINLIRRKHPQEHNHHRGNRRSVYVLCTMRQPQYRMGQIEDRVGPGEDHDDQESQTLPKEGFLPIN